MYGQPPLKRPRNGGLPPGWEEYFDDTHRRSYWFNDATGETTWERPEHSPPPPQQKPPPPPQATWEEHFDDDRGRPYWYNAATGESVWTKPGGDPPARRPQFQPPAAPAPHCGAPAALAAPYGAPAPAGQQLQGRVKMWNGVKGFGFIAPTDGSGDVFVHASAFNTTKSAEAQLIVGELVYYAPPVSDTRAVGGKIITKRVWGPGVDTGPAPGQLRGRVTKWNSDKGFGFIAPDDGSEAVFIHVTALGKGNGLVTGALVYYDPPAQDTRNTGASKLITKRAQGPALVPEAQIGGGGGGAPGAGGRPPLPQVPHVQPVPLIAGPC